MAAMDSDYSQTRRGGSGLAWLYMPMVLILFLGAALSVAAYAFADTDLTIIESVAVGFGGLASIIIALVMAAIGIVVGLIGALIGLVAAGGAVALTVFIIASPLIALILLVVVLRRPKNQSEPV